MKALVPDRLSLVYAIVMSAISTVAQAAIPVGYSVTQVNTIGGLSSDARAINDQGWVTGGIELTQDPRVYIGRAFLYNGATIDLGALPGNDASQGTAINNAGVVAGFSFNRNPNGPTYTNRAFRYNGALTDFGTSAFFNTYPTGINNLGQIAGTYYSDSSRFPNQPHAFLHSGGVTTDLGTLGGSSSQAQGINDSGQIVGSSYTAGDAANRGFSYANGVMTALGTLGGNSSEANDINNAGHIVGTSFVEGDQQAHAFLYIDGVMTDLGNHAGLDGGSSYAVAINDGGDVIGYADGAIGRSYFIYSDGVVRDIGGLLGTESGWSIIGVAGINSSGQIAVTAFKEGLGFQALRLDPIQAVPEPGTYAAFGAGMLLIALRLRRTSATAPKQKRPA